MSSPEGRPGYLTADGSASGATATSHIGAGAPFTTGGARRSDIEGLRALAVLSILVYHINPARLSGGFAGVDIFFVISGYLITSSIRSELMTGQFSYTVFLAKRAKRLFPALFAMLAAVILFAFFFSFPVEWVRISKSAIAAALYVSNIYFFAHSGYFDEAAETSPLLHTWSLGVEEQFYLFFPFFLLLVCRFDRGRQLPILVGATLAFYAGSLALANWNASAAFYWLPSRAWQFLLGGVLTFLPAPKREHVEPAAALGLLLIAGSFVFLDGGSFLPTLGGIFPTLGSALVIYAGVGGVSHVHRLLSLAPMAVVGRISYSVYLWHWPLVVFYHTNISSDTTPQEQLLLFVASLAAGGLSYIIFEAPLQRVAATSRRFKLLGASAAATALLCGLAGSVIIMQGMAGRLPEQARSYASYLSYDAAGGERREQCYLTRDDGDVTLDWSTCIQIDPDKRNLLLLGDSHAAHWYSALAKLLPDSEVSQLNMSGCRPTLEGEGRPRCTALMNHILRDIVPHRSFDAVILSGRWRPEDVPELKKTVDFLEDSVPEVFVFGPIIEYKLPLPRIIAKASLAGEDPYEEALTRLEDIKSADAAIKAAAIGEGATYISILDSICPGDVCVQVTPADVPIQYDYGHLTEEGSLFLMRRLLTAHPDLAN